MPGQTLFTVLPTISSITLASVGSIGVFATAPVLTRTGIALIDICNRKSNDNKILYNLPLKSEETTATIYVRTYFLFSFQRQALQTCRRERIVSYAIMFA